MRVAIAGVSWVGTRHVEAIRALGRKLTVDCLVDRDAAFLAEKSTKLAIEKTYGSIKSARESYELHDGDGQRGMLEWPVSELSDYAAEMEAFVDAVSGDAWGPTTSESERRSLAVVMAGYESAEREERIKLSEVFGNL